MTDDALQGPTRDEYIAAGYELFYSYTTWVDGKLTKFEKWMPPMPVAPVSGKLIQYKMPSEWGKSDG